MPVGSKRNTFLSASMTPDTAASTIKLTQLLNRLFFSLDEFRYGQVLQCFEADATWERQGEVLRGTDAMRAALDRRPSTQRIRHVVSNVLVEQSGADAARLVAYMTAYRYDDGVRREGPVRLDGPLRLSVVSGQARRSEAGWRLAELAVRTEFDFDAAS